MFTGFNLPDIASSNLDSQKERRQILEYLYQLTEQLRYVLSNIDEENLSPALLAKIGGENTSTSIEQTERMIGMFAKKKDVTAASIVARINEDEDGEVAIQAKKINLNGAVTANNGFKINVDGSMEASAGSLGAFSVDGEGNLAGAATLQVGGMTFSGNKASGLQVSADNLDYVYGQPSGSKTAYVLGISDTGQLCLFDLYISGGQLQISTPGDIPQSSAAEILRITARGDGLAKREYASTSAPSLGSCASGEVYGFSGTVTDAQGYLWARCTSKYTYNPGTALWSASGVAPFFIRQHSNGYDHRYYDFTTVNV